MTKTEFNEGFFQRVGGGVIPIKAVKCLITSEPEAPKGFSLVGVSRDCCVKA